MKNRIFIAGVTITSIFLIGTSIQASQINYNYAEIAYRGSLLQTDFEDDIKDGIGEVNPEGFLLKGALDVANNLFVFGHYVNTQGDVVHVNLGVSLLAPPGPRKTVEVDLDYTQFELGIGYHYAVTTNSDLIFNLAYLDQEIDFSGSSSVGTTQPIESFSAGSIGDSAIAVGLGLRSVFWSRLEINGQLQYINFDDAKVASQVGAVYNFTPQHALTVALSGDATFIDGDIAFSIGYRYNF